MEEDDAVQQDELEALEAIFGEADCCILSAVPPRRIQIDLKGESCPQNTVRLTAHLPSDYPSTSPPVCELSLLPAARDAACMRSYVANALQMLHFEPGGCGCLYEWVQQLNEQLPADPPEEAHSSVTSAPEDEQSQEAVVLIDHMNDSGSYLKKLRRWASQLGLASEIWFTLPVAASSANKKAGRTRAEKVYVLLSGDSRDIGTWLQRLKTEHVDVNKQGAKCKERQSKLLARRLGLSDASLNTTNNNCQQYDSTTVEQLHTKLAALGVSFDETR